MAARRLVIVMLVMLGISTLAAALVPPRTGDRDATTGTATEATEAATLPDRPRGRRLLKTIDATDDPVEVIPLRVGDQLQLEVRSRKLDEVEIPKLGLIEAVGPDGPATFNTFVTERAVYEIRLVRANRVAGRIEVGKRKRG
jgi:hypothetical protein